MSNEDHLIICNQETIFLFSKQKIEFYNIKTSLMIDRFYFKKIGVIYQANIFENDFLVWIVHNEVFILEIKTKTIKSFKIQGKGAFGSTFYQNYIIPAERDLISLWDIKSCTLVRSYQKETSNLMYCTSCIRDTYISGIGCSLEYFDFKTGKTERKNYGNDSIFYMDTSDQLGIIAFGSPQGRLSIVDLETKSLIHRYMIPDIKHIEYLYIFPDTVCAFAGKNSYLYDYKLDKINEYDTCLCTFSKNGDLILLEGLINDLKCKIIPRKSRLENVKFMKSWDLSFDFK